MLRKNRKMHFQLHGKQLIAIFFLVVFAVALALAGAGQNGQQSIPVGNPQERRFDYLVREDFFASIAGDWDALERAMKRCEEELAEDPKFAEALVWHGAGLMMRAWRAYDKGEKSKGDALWAEGIAEMERAVSYDPQNIAVRIPRGAFLLGVAQSGFNPDDKQQADLLRSALEDYEYVYHKQQPYFDKISRHSRCELILGLAMGWSLLAEEQKTRFYLERALDHCRNSEYERRARRWIGEPAVPEVRHTCIGCH